MVKINNAEALGIIFPNSYDTLVPELVSERSIASIPFASRYRVIDFVLSSMVNSGIDNISVIARKNYRSLMDHLGSGREWDLTRKNGGLNIIPPYAERTVQIYTGRIEALASILGLLKNKKEKYVVITDANVAINFDFKDMIKEHVKSGADVSVAYKRMEIPQGLKESPLEKGNLYYSLDIEDGRITKMHIDPKEKGEQNLCINIYVIDREMLIEQISDAYAKGLVHFGRDFLAPHLDSLNIHAYRYEGYMAHFGNLKSYFDENMKLLKDENLDALFAGRPIYTKIRDDNPTRYIDGAKAKNVMAADGCIIEGKIENCVLFRGVKIGKGAKVKNCVLMQDTVVEAGASIENVVTDKRVRIGEGKEIKGSDTFPVYIAKGQNV